MLKTIIRYGYRLRPAVNMRISTSSSNRVYSFSSNANQNGQIWPYVIVSRRTSMLEHHVKDAGQMRTPPPLTPSDVESRVLRICNEYDKIQESQKNEVNNAREKTYQTFDIDIEIRSKLVSTLTENDV